jgi:hypothetical protein
MKKRAEPQRRGLRASTSDPQQYGLNSTTCGKRQRMLALPLYHSGADEPEFEQPTTEDQAAKKQARERRFRRGVEAAKLRLNRQELS